MHAVVSCSAAQHLDDSQMVLLTRWWPVTYPKVFRERKRSGARFNCSHFVITGPPSLDVDTLAKLSPWTRRDISIYVDPEVEPDPRIDHQIPTPAESRLNNKPDTDRRLSPRKIESWRPIGPEGGSVWRMGISRFPADQVLIGGFGTRPLVRTSGRLGSPLPNSGFVGRSGALA